MIDERNGPPASPGFRSPPPAARPMHDVMQELIGVLDKALREDQARGQAEGRIKRDQTMSAKAKEQGCGK